MVDAYLDIENPHTSPQAKLERERLAQRMQRAVDFGAMHGRAATAPHTRSVRPLVERDYTAAELLAAADVSHWRDAFATPPNGAERCAQQR